MGINITFNKDLEEILLVFELDKNREKAQDEILNLIEQGIGSDEDDRPEIKQWLISEDWTKGRNQLRNEIREKFGLKES